MDVIFLACIALALGISGCYISRRRRTNRKQSPSRSHGVVSSTKALEARVIEPLSSFDWETTPPRKFRPFKPVYFITMALEADAPSELIIIDTNYPSRIAQRRDIIARHPATVHGCVPKGVEPVRELYEFLLASYLPTRYPTMFDLQDRETFVNTTTGSSHPVLPPADPLRALRILGETVEDDLFLVVETPGGHRLVAFACCFPSGFDPSSKLGRVLAEIHEPVPGYEKIGGSMERFFARLEVGKSVKRINWSVTTQEELFNPDGNHAEDPEAVEKDQDVDIEKARVRMELQTLTRLPRTKAILFSFKTYLYPVRDIKEEGLGPQFADAIEGLRRGNAPGMWTYKGAVRWGKSVCEYLRS